MQHNLQNKFLISFKIIVTKDKEKNKFKIRNYTMVKFDPLCDLVQIIMNKYNFEFYVMEGRIVLWKYILSMIAVVNYDSVNHKKKRIPG